MKRMSEILDDLNAEKLSLVDFDELRELLKTSCHEDESEQNGLNELAALRDDYTSRIGGMLKAISAVDRKASSMEDSLELIDKTQTMNAASLVSCYRRTSARFRDCFPASFGLLGDRSSKRNSSIEPNDYK
jgi:hypothetical protein